MNALEENEGGITADLVGIRGASVLSGINLGDDDGGPSLLEISGKLLVVRSKPLAVTALKIGS